MSDINEDLDRPLWGAEAIGREANILDDSGNVNLRAVYHALENGYLPADKFGKKWVSTRRRLRRAFAGQPA